MTDLTFQCSCGALKGEVHDASPATGTHAECFCSSCRAGEVYAGAVDPASDPVGIFQTSPHRMQITSGAENLAVFSFGPKNLLRWHASCCGSPLFNTPRNPKVSFVGIRTNRLSDTSVLGPVVGQAFMRTANGKTKHKGLRKLVIDALIRIAGNRFSGRWKETPLFDVEAAVPVADVTLVSWAARKALLAS